MKQLKQGTGRKPETPKPNIRPPAQRLGDFATTNECCTENCSCNQKEPKEPKDNEPIEEASKETDLVKRSDVVAEINRIKDGLGTARVFMFMSMDENLLKEIANFCSMLDQLVLNIKRIKPAKDVAEPCLLCSLRSGNIQPCGVPPDHDAKET